MFGRAQRFWFIPLVLILALVHVQPAAAQETPPSEATLWFTHRVAAYKEEGGARKEASELAAMGVKNVAVWVRPTLLAPDDTFTYFVLIGPFPNEAAATKAADAARAKVGKVYLTQPFRDIIQLDKKDSVIYAAIAGRYPSVDDAGEAQKRLNDARIPTGLYGVYGSLGDYYWLPTTGFFRVRANAEKAAAKLKELGYSIAFVETMDGAYAEKVEGYRIAARTPRAPAKPSDDYNARWLKWKECEKQYSFSQPEKVATRCGNMPNF